jgi:hypothetical protein
LRRPPGGLLLRRGIGVAPLGGWLPARVVHVRSYLVGVLMQRGRFRASGLGLTDLLLRLFLQVCGALLGQGAFSLRQAELHPRRSVLAVGS